MNNPKLNFDSTALRLIRDVSSALGRDYKDPDWVGKFCLPMVGNLAHECGGFALMEEGSPTVKGSLGGISFAQWTGMNAAKGGRRALFMAHCRARRLHPYGYDAAMSFIVRELTTTATGVVAATLSAKVVEPETVGLSERSTDKALLGRVIRFERLYENAGVKHYPSRYKWAVRAFDVYARWARAGFPEPGVYVMPKARFSAEFDREFGLGVTATTVRWDGRPTSAGDALASMRDTRDAPPPALPGRAPVGNERSLTQAEWRVVQLALRDAGFTDVGVADGRPGTKTRDALKAFQALAGIEPDGRYGAETRKALDAGAVKKPPPPIRQDVTTHELRAAGEPVLVAAKPVSTVSQATAVISTLAAAAGGIASLWPQASAALDGLKASVGEVPGWVWPLCTAGLAVWFYYQNKRVQAAQVEAFKAGAVNTVGLLALPDRPALPSAEPHYELRPGETVQFHPGAPSRHSRDVLAALGMNDLSGLTYEQVAHHPDVLPSDEARPLGVDDEDEELPNPLDWRTEAADITKRPTYLGDQADEART